MVNCTRTANEEMVHQGGDLLIASQRELIKHVLVGPLGRIELLAIHENHCGAVGRSGSRVHKNATDIGRLFLSSHSETDRVVGKHKLFVFIINLVLGASQYLPRVCSQGGPIADPGLVIVSHYCVLCQVK